jgi:hypothetical protein
MLPVTKIVKLMSSDLENLILHIEAELGMVLEIGSEPADQIYLKDPFSGVLLNEPILKRLMCNGEFIYVFEYKSE